ncbi:MAG: YveK family protein [Acidimicrobiales bacterium]
MEFYRYLTIIRRRWLLVIITVAAAVFAGWAITPRDSQYTATSTIYVGNRIIDFQGAGLSVDRALALDRLLGTFSLMIDAKPVATEAINRTGVDRNPEEVVDATTVAPPFGTQLLNIRVTDRDPRVARDLANGLADAFRDQVEEYEGGDIDSETGTSGEGDLPSGLPAYVYERATLPTAPQPSDLLHNILLGGLFGLVASILLAFTLEYLDLTVRSASDAERRLDLPVLGVVPSVRREMLGFVRISRQVMSPGATPVAAKPTTEDPAR